MPKLCDAGENDILAVYLGGAVRSGLYLGLYVDTAEPGEAATLATITELAVAHGYARIALANGDWTVVADLATHVPKAFTADGADWGLVYGYFICTAASGTVGKVLWVESFSDGPYNVLNGLLVKVTPKILAA